MKEGQISKLGFPAKFIFEDLPPLFNLLIWKQVSEIKAFGAQIRNGATSLPPDSYVKYCKKEGPRSK